MWSNTLRKLDPRYYILLFLCCFVFAGQFFLGFFQKWDAVFASILSTVLTELLLVRFLYKQWKFPLSALITGLGISLLLSSHLLWPYILTSVLAIFIKFMVRYKGSHIFNPNNAAMVFMLFFLPQYAVSTPKQWSNGFEIMLLVLLLGFIAVYVANRIDTVLAFISGFVAFAFVRHLLFDQPLLWTLGPMLGAAFQLFVFFMITDPKTTPSTRKMRVIVGVAIAFADAILRVLEITNSQFYAAFLITLLLGLPYKLVTSKKLRMDV